VHRAACGGHIEVLKLLLKTKPRVDVKDQSFDGTPLGWALYAWREAPADHSRDRYYDVVGLLVREGAPVDPKWLNNPSIADDPRMVAALGSTV